MMHIWLSHAHSSYVDTFLVTYSRAIQSVRPSQWLVRHMYSWQIVSYL